MAKRKRPYLDLLERELAVIIGIRIGDRVVSAHVNPGLTVFKIVTGDPLTPSDIGMPMRGHTVPTGSKLVAVQTSLVGVCSQPMSFRVTGASS